MPGFCSPQAAILGLLSLQISGELFIIALPIYFYYIPLSLSFSELCLIQSSQILEVEKKKTRDPIEE
jgi:hypothetical protein